MSAPRSADETSGITHVRPLKSAQQSTSVRESSAGHGASAHQNTGAAGQATANMPKVLDFVIVLCPNIGFGPELEEYAPDGLYIGARARMQAAADLFHRADPAVKKYIVVGGGLEQSDHRLRWKKTEHMREFLIRSGVPPKDILCVASEPDTSGNFRAIWKTCHAQLRAKTIGVLTNQYHVPRALCIATDPQFDWGGAQFIPLPAESLLAGELGLPAPGKASLAGRLAREQHGLGDWQRGEYRNQHMPQRSWQGSLRTEAIDTHQPRPNSDSGDHTPPQNTRR